MGTQQQNFKTEDYFCKQHKSYSNIITKNNSKYLKAMIFKQSSRIIYRVVLSFWDIQNYCKNISIDTSFNENNNNDYEYLDNNHINDITLYIHDNIEDFILPTLTATIHTPLIVVHDVNNPTTTTIDTNDLSFTQGCIFGYIELPSNIKFTILDGNHRNCAIDKLLETYNIDDTIDGLHVGVDLYLEENKITEQQLFMYLNSHQPINSSMCGLLNKTDLMSNSIKELLGLQEDDKYVVTSFKHDSSNYIGVEFIKDNILHSNNTLSVNMIKNMLSILALDNVNIYKKFNNIYAKNKLKYFRLMRDVSTFLNYIFLNCEPFSKINKDLSNVQELREQYISMTGAGLYVIAKIGHIAIKYEEINIEKLAKAICKLDWKREQNGVMNEIFIGGILTSKGKISNNRTALNTSLNRIKEMLKLTDKDIQSIIRK